MGQYIKKRDSKKKMGINKCPDTVPIGFVFMERLLEHTNKLMRYLLTQDTTFPIYCTSTLLYTIKIMVE